MGSEVKIDVTVDDCLKVIRQQQDEIAMLKLQVTSMDRFISGLDMNDPELGTLIGVATYPEGQGDEEADDEDEVSSM